MSTSQSVVRITTVEELDALPVGAILRDRRGEPVGRSERWGWCAGNGVRDVEPELVIEDGAPLTLLYPLPDAPTPSAEVGEVSPIESHRTNSGDRESLVRAAAENVRRVGASNVASVIEATLDVALTARQPALVVSAEQVEAACYPHQDPNGPDLRKPVVAALDALGIEVSRG